MHLPLLNQYTLGVILTIISAVGFASKTILAKLCYSYGMTTVSVLALRMIFSGIIFFFVFVYNVKSGRWNLVFTRREIASAFILGAFGYYLSAVLDFTGLNYVDAGLGRMILFLYPTIVVLINAAMTRSKIRLSTWLSLFLCYCGIILMMAGSLANALDSKNIYLGSFLIFCAAAVYAFYMVALDRLINEFEPLRFTSLILCVSCFISFGHYLVSYKIVDILSMPTPGILYCLLMGLVATVMPIYALTAGISRVGASRAAMLSMFGPVITLGMGVVFLNETLNFGAICGVVLILLGVLRIGRS